MSRTRMRRIGWLAGHCFWVHIGEIGAIGFFVLLSACGSRTRLDAVGGGGGAGAGGGQAMGDDGTGSGSTGGTSGTGGTGGSAGTGGAGSSAAAEGAGATPVCSDGDGPLASCAQASSTEPVQICGKYYSRCVQPSGSGEWACCFGDGPYDDPLTSCLFVASPSFLCGGFQETLHLGAPDSGGDRYTGVCLTTNLAFEPSGLPACGVIEYRFPPGTGTGAEIAACQRCEEPGLAVPSSAALGQGGSLESYACKCAVAGEATCPHDPEGNPPAGAWWCYAPATTPSQCFGGLQVRGVPGDGAVVSVSCVGLASL